MTILTKREVWRKPRPANATRRSSDLTPEEHANVEPLVDLDGFDEPGGYAVHLFDGFLQLVDRDVVVARHC